MHFKTAMRTPCAILFFFLFLISTFFPSALAYDPEYLSHVVGRKAVSLGDGCELIMYLLNREGGYSTFESQIEYFKQAGIVKRFNPERGTGSPLRRGELSFMLVKALQLRGGLKARLLGWNERFAMEELIHHGIMREGHLEDLVTGQELVVIMTQAAEHLAARRNR